ncbi:uncharacterized protein TNCV_4221611 [Trichonephila clavipes]|nr:uncharacterized protein TNCV_4221611 [Trichonephila clavipes]
MACYEEDCGFQMLNGNEIVTFVQEESDPVDDETDEDEDNNNNNESSIGPSNACAFSALETDMEWYEQQSECCSTQLLLLKRIRNFAARKRRCTMVPRKIVSNLIYCMITFGFLLSEQCLVPIDLDKQRSTVVLHLIAILRATIASDQSQSKESQIICLEIVQSIIKWCWPRMEYHCFDILVCILDLQEQSTADASSDAVGKINHLSEECLTLLMYSCERKFKSLVADYIEDSEMPGHELLKKVMQKECPMLCVS